MSEATSNVDGVRCLLFCRPLYPSFEHDLLDRTEACEVDHVHERVDVFLVVPFGEVGVDAYLAKGRIRWGVSFRPYFCECGKAKGFRLFLGRTCVQNAWEGNGGRREGVQIPSGHLGPC